ncbi:MAG: K(+)-transporting ATPase subunit C [Parachlamydiales bacterium]|jgi:K+-transporting ATPase ATPase C chain
MKKILSDLKTSLIIFFSLSILLGIVYPLFIYGIGYFFFPDKANGSLVYDKTRQIVIGSELIGQQFSSMKYFHSRPVRDSGKDPQNSSGNNLGPTSKKLQDSFESDIVKYQKINKLSPNILIPIDAVTSSFSGLDPHISVRNAELQMPRVAKARNIEEKEISILIEKFTEKPFLGVLGQKRVNVLLLNIALDEIK